MNTILKTTFPFQDKIIAYQIVLTVNKPLDLSIKFRWRSVTNRIRMLHVTGIHGSAAV